MSADEIQIFLNGEIHKFDDYKYRLVMDWFIGTLWQADWFVSDVIHYSKDVMGRETPSAVGDYDFILKRERFTFHEIHIAVLEANFKRNSYPSVHEKTLIANQCNIEMIMSSGHECSEKDRVTSFNVEDWFRNERKMLSRKTRMAGGTDSSQEVLANQLITPSEVDRRMQMKHSDVCVAEMSNPPVTAGQIYENQNSPQHISTLPMCVPLRPSISVPSRSSSNVLLSQQLPAPNLPDTSTITSTSTGTCANTVTTTTTAAISTGDETNINNVIIQEEITSGKEISENVAIVNTIIAKENSILREKISENEAIVNTVAVKDEIISEKERSGEELDSVGPPSAKFKKLDFPFSK